MAEGDGMTKEIIFMVEEEPERGYIAKAAGHSIFTQAETADELKIRAFCVGIDTNLMVYMLDISAIVSKFRMYNKAK